MRGRRRMGGYGYRNQRDRKQGNIRSLVLLAITTIGRDLLSQDSKIKSLANRIFKPKQLPNNQQDKQEIVNAEYKIIDGEKDE